MTWTAGAAPTDPVVSTLTVTDLTTATAVGTVSSNASALNGGEGDLYQSQYLGGPGYLWFTFWDAGFSNGQLQVASVEVEAVPEPGSLALVLAGTAAVLGLARRRA
jgi:hypothetical protein